MNQICTNFWIEAYTEFRLLIPCAISYNVQNWFFYRGGYKNEITL